jgi:dihydroflavonol-4-reductase
MTVVVTGAAGHIGGTLVRALLDYGEPVRALVHQDRRALLDLDVETVQGDVRDPDSLHRAFDGVHLVFHAAGYISLLLSEWRQLHAVNVLGTQNVVQACLACKVDRLVHFSSIHALAQAPLDLPVDELRPLVGPAHPIPYDRSKADAERQVLRGLAEGLDAVILNPTGIIGPHDYRVSRMGHALLALAQGRLPGLVQGGFDWVDVRDVAEGAVRAAEVGTTGARYLLSGHWVSLRDLAAMAGKITGRHAPLLVCPMSLAKRVAPLATLLPQRSRMRTLFTPVALDALCGNRTVSHARATQELGYHPRSFADTLLDTLTWFEKAGYLVKPLQVRSPEAL